MWVWVSGVGQLRGRALRVCPGRIAVAGVVRGVGLEGGEEGMELLTRP